MNRQAGAPSPRRAWLFAIVLVLAAGAVLALLRAARATEGAEAPPQVWHSALWGAAGEAWTPTSRLPDFSFAGYGMGERPLPDPPVVANVRDFGAVGDGLTDDSQAFLDALASAPPGAILVPRGRYLLTRVLRIDRPGVVLRGEGPGRSVLLLPRSLHDVLGDAPAAAGDDGHWSWGGAFLWLSGRDEGVRVTEIAARARRGDRRLVVSDARGLKPGDLIRVVQTAADSTLWAELNGGPVPVSTDLIEWSGGVMTNFITPISCVVGDTVWIERPLRVDVGPEREAALWTHAPTVRDVGVEGLTIDFTPPAPYEGHLVESGRNAIFLDDVFQFWIRDVEILNADGGILSDGPSAFGTIQGIRLGADGRTGAETGHHGIALEGPNDVLVTDFRLDTRFRHDLTVDALASGNVFEGGRGVDLAIDHHTSAPYENLFSDIDVGLGTRVWFSGGSVERGGPHAGVRETVWNLRTSAGAVPFPDYPQLTVVSFPGVQRPGRDDQWSEGKAGGILAPQSLYAAQLRTRLGRSSVSPECGR